MTESGLDPISVRPSCQRPDSSTNPNNLVVSSRRDWFPVWLTGSCVVGRPSRSPQNRFQYKGLQGLTCEQFPLQNERLD